MMAEESKTTLTPNGYSFDDFRTAVVQGKHPDGDTLNEIMPRWQMSDQDLEDLFTYLKTLP
jgi:cytochrome c oxidase subunit II